MLLPKNIIFEPRVAMYIWRFPPVVGGAEKQCKILSEELAKKGASVFIVTEMVKNTKGFEIINNVQVYRAGSLDWLRRLPVYAKQFFYSIKQGEKDPWPRPDGQNKFKIVKMISGFLTHKVPNCYFFLTSLWIFYKKRNEFDVIHIHEAHWIASFGVTIARLLKKKIIIKEAITGEMMSFKTNSGKSRKRLMQADLFIAISNKIFADLVSLGVPGSKIKKIPNGVEVNNGKWQFNSSAGRPVVSVAKLDRLSSWYKGLDILLEAWGILVQKHRKQAGIRIFGRGSPYRMNQLAAKFGIRDYVEFPGFVADIRRHLLDSCLFVLPSREEGLSNALLEAMSLGLPCVATDISGSQDLIQSGTNGLLVPSESPQALADAVSFMMNNPDKASAMGENARRTIEGRYSISLICNKYLELYKDLCAA